jgi:hypothetical protein
VAARVVDSGELTEGTVAGFLDQAERLGKAEREGKSPAATNPEGRCQISVQIGEKASLSREEIDAVVRGLLGRLGARTVTDSTEW